MDLRCGAGPISSQELASRYRVWFLFWFLHRSFIARQLDCHRSDPKVKKKLRREPGGVMRRWTAAAKRSAIRRLGQGISSRRLALTLALGFAIGCIPVIGVPTVLCATVALALRLNLPAIQAANYAAMPLQLALIVPFTRLGRWLAPWSISPPRAAMAMLRLPALDLAARMGSLAGQALLAWLLIAIPAVALMTVTLTLMLRRIPLPRAAEAGN